MAILSSKILEQHKLGDYFGVDSFHIREQVAVAAVVVEIVAVVVIGVVAVAGIAVGIVIADIAEDIP